MDVLDDHYCEAEMTQNGTLTFDHKPEVICVGLNHSYNIRVYLRDQKGRYHHISEEDAHYESYVSVEKLWYIVGNYLSKRSEAEGRAEQRIYFWRGTILAQIFFLP